MEMTAAARRGVTPGRRISEVVNHGVRIVLVLLILFFVNLLLRDRYVRADLTQDRSYTISKATKDLVRGLDDLVTIKAYVSEELPKEYAATPRRLRDFLDEYVVAGRGKVRAHFIDPANDPKEQEIARQIGINPYPLQEIQQDQVKVLNCYLSLAVFYGAEQEHLNLFEGASDLEYDLTRAIRKVSTDDLPKIGVIAPDPPPRNQNPQESPQVTFQKFQGELETQYRVQRVYTKTGTPVPDDIRLLLVVRPKDLSAREAFEIDQFVMRGGHAIFCLDGNDYQPGGGGIRGTPITTGLDGVLAAYGVKMKPGLVLDKRMNAVRVAQRQGPIQVVQEFPYPFWIRIQKDTMASESPIVRNLDLVQLFWAQPLEIDREKIPGVEVIELLKTSADTWLRSDTRSVNVDTTGAAYLPPAEKDRKPELVAAILKGTFHSAFAGQPVPEPATPDVPPGPPGAPEFPPGIPPELREKLSERGLSPAGPVPPGGGEKKDPDERKPPPAPPAQEEGGQDDEIEPGFEEPAEPPREVIAESPETRILVMSDSDILADNFLDGANWAFFLNTVDWFLQDENLISIRSRDITDRSLEKTEEDQRKMLKAVGTFALPLVVAVFGFVYLSLRKRRS